MDNLAHSLFGVALARAGLAQRFGRGTTALVVLASNLPDVDAVLMFTHGQDAAWMRRTHSHCIVGAPLLGLLLAVGWWLAARGRWRLRDAAGLSLLGVAGHVGMDLLNSYGVVALWPFSWTRFELAWAFIIDLATWGLLLAPLLLHALLRGRVREETLFRGALVAYAAYLACCGASHAWAERMLSRELGRRALAADVAYVFPEALGAHRWRGVAREGDTWRLWLVDVPRDRLDLALETRTVAEDERLAAVRATPEARRIEWFFKAPVWTIDEERGVARVTDLRFRSVVLKRRGTFAWEFPLEPAPR